MDVKTTAVNGDSRQSEAPPRAFARSVGDVGSDILTLTELQVQLAWQDLKLASRKASGGVAAALVAVGCALGGLPILVLGVAEMLIHFLGWARWATLLSLGGLTLGASIALAYFGARRVFRAVTILGRSKDELIRNLEWIKAILKRATG